LTLYAGVGLGFNGDGGPAIQAQFWCLGDMAFDSAGNLYVLDGFNNRVRRIEPNGTISALAGSGAVGDFVNIYPANGGFAGDGGPATEALLWDPYAISLDQLGNLYILDRHNNRVRKVDQAGIITTLAGVGTQGFSGDGGPATAAEIGPTNGLAVDVAGNVYIGDVDNARIRKVDLEGIITTIAGTGERGFSGDGGPAAEAQLSRPLDMVVDAAGSLYFVDATSGTLETDRIRKINADGTITTLTSVTHPGNPFLGWSYTSLKVDSTGSLYFGYTGNVIRKIDQDGTVTVVVKGCNDCP
jgi:sugar lactone lactonase YvrE